jgi:branched-chain amino acid transport system substrate-binding protein
MKFYRNKTEIPVYRSSSYVPGKALVFLLIMLQGCIFRDPVKIGFVSELSGRQTALGVQSRNGVLIAVDEINASGGIAGRRVELVIKDDFGTDEGARTADSQLVESGVAAIIGHSTSKQTIAGLQVTQKAGIVLISPTTSTSLLKGIDDLFFRLCPSTSDPAPFFAGHIFSGRGLKTLSVIYDSDNEAYSKTYWQVFKKRYIELGGKIKGEAAFSSGADPDFTNPVLKLRRSDPDAFFIIASALDTALIAQKARLTGWDVPLFTTTWAQMAPLIQNGGRAVEGMEFDQLVPDDIRNPRFTGFRDYYMKRYGHKPLFPAFLGYETAMVLAKALEKTGGKPDNLHDALLGIKNYQGLADTFSFDRYGEAQRPFYLGTVKNGMFVNLGILKPLGE